MANSLIEKYELILAADPRSRVFVELARALVERGDHSRAIQICESGLEHHPDSILARVLWGRALLGLAQIDEALAQFDIAIAIDPGNPYAYNLIGEALVQKGLHRAALPVLMRAAQLQPGDDRIQAQLEEAKRNADAGAGNPRRAGAELEPQTSEAVPGMPPEQGAASAERSSSGPASAPMAAPTPDSVGTENMLPQIERASPTDLDSPNGDSGSAAGGAPPPWDPMAPSAPMPPPLRRNPLTPPPVPSAHTTSRFALDLIPGASAPAPSDAAASSVTCDPAEAARLAEQYERELRDQIVAPEPPRGFVRRHLLSIAISTGLVLAAIGGAATYLSVRRHNRSAEVKSAVEAAKKGLARDTLGSLREAARVLADARDLDPKSREAISLSAQVAGLLWTDFGDEKAKALAEKLATDTRAGEGGLVVRYLLEPGPRAAAAEPVVSAPHGGPLVEDLAGRILLARGDSRGALRRFEVAAGSSPPFLRAIADRADFELAQDDLDAALADYRAALAAHATHPRSAIGAAEARLALSREIPEAVRTLEAVAADPGSAPAKADQVRFEVAYARCLAAMGNPAAGAERLERAAEKLGAKAPLAGAFAEIELRAGAFDKAEVQADRAVRLAPREPSYRVLLARAEIARGRYREALRATEGVDTREAHLQRGVAYYELREYAQARSELERTRREGRMPAEAAAYLALCDFARGKQAAARALLERLVAGESPHPTVLVALGQIELARGRADLAEKHFRSALARDPATMEAHCGLGRLLLARGRTKEALASLEQAVRLDPLHAEARLALGHARLASGDPAGARTEFERVVSDQPREAEALRGLSAARLAMRDPVQARSAAERAITAEPRNPASYVAAARAALAQGDAAGARRYAARALKLSPRGDAAVQARRVLEQAKRRKV